MNFDWRQPLIREDGQVDEGLMQQYMANVVEPFIKSPAAVEFERTHDTAGWPIQFGMHSIYVLKRLLHRIEPKHQEKVLLHSFPERLVTYPEVARDIIEELRLMWQYFYREYQWPHAMSCHDALEENYVERLNYGFTDPDNFCETKKLMLFADKHEVGSAATNEFVTIYVKKSDVGRRDWACQTDNLFSAAMQQMAAEASTKPAKEMSLKERQKMLRDKLRRPR
jgi:hypothetical protein